MRVQSSTWLRSGDVVNLGAGALRIADSDSERVVEVDDGSSGNITAPPIIPASARLQGQSDGDAERIEAIRFRTSEAAKPVRRVSLSPLRVVLAAVGVVAAVVLWFIFTATSVSLRTEPAAANVRVSGGLPAWRLGDRVLLRPGNYHVRAELAGYVPAQLQIKVTSAPNQAFAMTLAKLPGRLAHRRSRGCARDDRRQGSGQRAGRVRARPGPTHVAIAAERYQPFSADVDVEGLGKTQTFKPQLVPGWGVVSVTSEPAGAQLVVNGEPRGVTPLTDRNHGGRASGRTASGRLQAVDDGYPGEGQRAAVARPGETWPAGRTARACVRIRRARASPSPACIADRRRWRWSCGRISITASC